MLGQPVVNELSNGMRLFWLPTDKFKTVSVKLFIHQELEDSLVTKNALLPSVLERGTQQHPDRISLRRELEDLYGAELSTDVGKKGERHLIEFSLEMVHENFFEEKDLLRRGLEVMEGLISNPLVEDEGFCRSYVEQEKVQLAQEIKSLVNNKIAYALERCVQEMCRGERYGLYKLGKVEDLEQINAVDLYEYSQELFSRNPVDIYLVGLQQQEEAESLVNDVFSLQRNTSIVEIPPTTVYREKEEVTRREEIMSVSQGNLVLGYRTNIPYDHELYYPLVMCNGILGGFPHSKLFQNVREKSSLAYFVFSRLERHKGVMISAAGIDPSQYENSLEIMQKQLEAISKGEITEEEMENTRIGLINQLRTQQDNPNSLVNFYLDAEIGGRKHGFSDVIEKIQQVTVDEVVEAASRIKLDTIYFLHGEEGGGSK